MAVVSTVFTSRDGVFKERHVEVGSPNTQLVTTTPAPAAAQANRPRRLSYVTVAYTGGAVTQTGVIVELDAGAGAGYDSRLTVASANALYSTYVPATPLLLLGDDAIRVTAPAGGAGLTANISVYLENAE